MDDSIHENERGDIRDHYVRCGSRSQDTIHSYFNNDGESVDGDGRSGFMSQTRTISPIIQVGLTDHWVFMIMVIIEVEIVFSLSNILFYPIFPQKSI